VNILDENIVFEQREVLRRLGIPFRQIGFELSSKGIKDPQVIPLLLRLKQPTFFTRDFDYFDANLCHQGYCLVWLNVRPDEVGVFIRRFLRHSDFCTHQQRLGRVVRVHQGGINYWQRGQRKQTEFAWC
jgi:hypothetical protein